MSTIFRLALAAAALGPAVGAPSARLAPVGADLAISPSRVVLGDGDRSASVTLLNSSDRTVRYRLSLVEMRMTDDGELAPAQGSPPESAARFLRFSPREVALAPGGWQRVKVMAELPPGLADGEWRSHLRFEPLSRVAAPPSAVGRGVRLSLTMRSCVTIPIFVRHGRLSASASISEPSIRREGGQWVAEFTLGRTGGRSLRGLSTVSFEPRTGKPRLLAEGETPLYAPNAARRVRLALGLDPTSLPPGSFDFRFAEPGRSGASAGARLTARLTAR